MVFVLLVLAIGWGSGRLDQRVFDDEVLTLVAIDKRSYEDLIRFFVGGNDVHPPLAFLWFRALQDLAAPLWLQRAISLGVAATGFALMLDLVWRRLPEAATASRLLAVVMFLGAPLLFGMGAALRWYPLLVLPVCLGIWSCLGHGRPTILAAFAFGCAANISFLAVIPAGAYLAWRYLMARRFRLAWDGPFLVMTALLAIPGLTAFVMSLDNLLGQMQTNSVVAIGLTALGMTGGYGLGLSQAFVAAPLAVLGTLGLFGAALAHRRPSIGDLLSVSLLVLGICVALSASGFAKPRSFLFAVPFFIALTVLGGFSLPWRRTHAVATMAASVIVSFASLWYLNGNDRPFKRNLHIRNMDVLATVRLHAAQQDSLIVVTEPGLAWALHGEGYCVVAAAMSTGCSLRTAPTIVLIDDGTLAQRVQFSAAISGMTAEHRLAFQTVFGDDRDAATKTALTGRLVPAWLVSVAVYRHE